VENQSSESTPSIGDTSSKDILIVVSKMKDYIQKTAGLNTSGTVASVISDRVRALCDEAVRNATSDGRKTVMDRDFRVS
jgi:histone H3/H4